MFVHKKIMTNTCIAARFCSTVILLVNNSTTCLKIQPRIKYNNWNARHDIAVTFMIVLNAPYMHQRYLAAWLKPRAQMILVLKDIH